MYTCPLRKTTAIDIDIIKRRGRGQVYTKWAKTEILNVIAGEVQESGEQD